LVIPRFNPAWQLLDDLKDYALSCRYFWQEHSEKRFYLILALGMMLIAELLSQLAKAIK